MKKFGKLSLLFLLVSCGKEGLPEKNVSPAVSFELGVSVCAPQPAGKVTFDGVDLVWDGTETLGVIIGDDNSVSGSPSTYNVQCLNTAATPGVFCGTVDLGSFTEEDIHGVVIPYSATDSWFRNNNGSHRIVMQFGTVASKAIVQTQKYDNVLEGKYATLFAEMSSTDFRQDDLGRKKVENLDLKWGCALLRFNVYGTHSSMDDAEVLKSVALSIGNGIGTAEWQIEAQSFNFNTTSGTVTVNLEQACEIAGRNRDNGVKLFATLAPRAEKGGTAASATKVVVTTDKAVYTKTISKSIQLYAGKVIQIGLDISSFKREAL